MQPLSQAQYQPAPVIQDIADFLADPVDAARFPQSILRFRNDCAAATIGLGPLSDADWIRHFGAFSPLPDNLPQPLALRYHGHQFRTYNPEIGDGRGFLFAQCRDAQGRLLDLGTKGSGTTPYSRFGDGRLTLKGAVREILATEMLEALGVITSRTFSVIETGEALDRSDEPSPTRGAVLVRLSHSHLRIGSFQRLAALGETANLKRLTAYALAHYFNEADGDDAPQRLLRHTVNRTATLAASYMAAGFVHGVLNSDNINITGESFDYGPWRFTPYWDARFVAAYFDHNGLYAFGRQAEAIFWDVVQLAQSLATYGDHDALRAALDDFGPRYQAEVTRHICWRLGVVPPPPPEGAALVQAVEQALLSRVATIDAFFFDWQGGRLRAPHPRYDTAAFAALATLLAPLAPARATTHRYWQSPAPCSMHIDEVEAIWSAIANDDDWTPLYTKVEAIRAMGDALAR